MCIRDSTGDARPAGGGKLAVVKAGDKHIARHLQAVLPQGDERACGCLLYTSTHLDVYKRQVFKSASKENSPEEPRMNASAPAS